MTCTLLTKSYLSRCHNVSSISSSYSNITSCLQQDSGTCDDLVEEDCNMDGNIVFQTDAVKDAIACQDYLQLFGSLYGAEAFFFSKPEGVCYLLDSRDRSCESMSGPKGVSTTCFLATATTSTAGKVPLCSENFEYCEYDSDCCPGLVCIEHWDFGQYCIES